MMPLKCRSCKHYATIYRPIYHGTVEGCGCDNNNPYPNCYEEKTKEETKDGSMGCVQ